MKKLLTIIFAITTAALVAQAASDIELGLVSDGGPWNFYPAKNPQKGLPRVLLIGDSVMNGYHARVINGLKGTANVDYWLTPKHLASPKLHAAMQTILNQKGVHYDVIHFNIGLHGWAPGRILPEQYEPLLREYVEILRSHSSRTRLIWASTTPITVKGQPTKLHPANNPIIAKRNAIAARIMPEYGVTINDLYGLASKHLNLMRGDSFHWKSAGYAIMTKQIVASIKTALNSRPTSATFFVSRAGNDSNPGSKTRPFKTLTRTLQAINNLPPHKTRTMAFLRTGIYEITDTLALGSKTALSTWRAFPGEKASLIGGKTLPALVASRLNNAAVKKRIIDPTARNKVMVIDLKKAGITDFGKMRPRGFRRPYIPSPLELFVDNNAMHLARWPNPGEPQIKIGKVLNRGSIPRKGDFSNRGATFKFAPSRPLQWQQADDIWISGLFFYGFADDTVKIKKIDATNKTIATVQPHMYGFHSGHPWNSWYALNLLEEIDQPGEYFCDTKKGLLYFYPPKNFNPQKSKLQISVLEKPIMAIENTTGITVKNLTIEATRGMGVYIEGGDSNQIVGCTMRNIGMVAVCIGRGTEDLAHYAHAGTAKSAPRRLGSWHEHIYENPEFDRLGGRHNGVKSCHIYNIGAGAISLGGGNRQKLQPAGNFVRNCRIYDYNRLGRSYKAGINIDGVGNYIEHCEIYNAPAVAIYLHGNDHTIAFNDIHDAMLDGDDMGAVYLGRDPSEFGNLINCNYLHDIGRTPRTHSTYGLYYDDMACGTTASSNVFYRVGKRAAMLIGGGKYNVTENNIAIECPLLIRMGNRGQTWAKGNVKKGGLFEIRTLKKVNITKPPYSTAYPQLAKYWQDNPGAPANPIRGNLLYKTKLTNAKPAWGPITNNWATNDDPGFVDLKNRNFNLKPDSPVFQKIKGFKAPPFDKMGLQKSFIWQEWLQ